MTQRAALVPSAMVAGICLSAVASSQISKVGKAYLFRVKFSAGAVLKYRTALGKSLAPGSKATFEVPLVQTVVAVHHDVGDIVVRSGPISFNGHPVGTAKSFRMQVDIHGKMVGGQIASNSGITAFPLGPIKPGDTWKASVPMAASGFGSGSSMVTMRYRFVKMTTYKGKPVAELAMTLAGGGTTTISAKGTEFVSAKDGNITYQSIKFSVALTSDMMPVTMDVEVTRS